MLGINDMNADQMTKKLEDTLPVIQQVSQQFKNPVWEKFLYYYQCEEFFESVVKA